MNEATNAIGGPSLLHQCGLREIDHKPFRRACFGRQSGEDAHEHAEPTPADEAVVKGLVRAIGTRRVLPLQAIANDVNDPADDAGHRHANDTAPTTGA